MGGGGGGGTASGVGTTLINKYLKKHVLGGEGV